MKRIRAKARPGRLKGKEMESLRWQAFLRDRGLCVDCGSALFWDTFHLAHRQAKRRHGDTLSNVHCKCPHCHIIEHAYGPTRTKPCPPKH